MSIGMQLAREYARRMVLACVVLAFAGVTAAHAQHAVATVRGKEDGMLSGEELLAKQVTVTLTRVSLLCAIDSVARLANVVVQYRIATLDTYHDPVNVKAANTPLGIVLEHLLDGTRLRVVSDGQGHLLVIGSARQSAADSVQHVGIVTGRVVDSATGRALPGATLTVVGTKTSTITTDSGRFTLRDVPVGDRTLTVKLFGYRPIEKSVTVVEHEQTPTHIVMVQTALMLSQVVTTAVGQQKQYAVGSDITVLNADSIQRVAPITNLTQMLETRVPGLVVQHTSGIPGAPSRLRLRGISSINMSSDPILIVDGVRVYADQSGGTNGVDQTKNGKAAGTAGVTTFGGGSSVTSESGTFAGPSALDQLDPNSIETIEVLKGPSATATYGSDAASGVIVVTTKHGHAGPTRWTVSLDQGRTTLPGQWPINYFQFGHTLGLTNPIASGLCLPFDPTCIKDSLVAYQALNNPRYSPLTGRPGQNRDASLTVSGGNGTITYSVTGTAATQSGYLHLPSIEQARFQEFHRFSVPQWMITPDQYTTYSGSSTIAMQLGQRGGTLALTSSLFRSAQQQSSLQNDLATLSTMYVDTTQLGSVPLFPDYYTRAQLRTTTYTNAVSLSNWKLWEWLPLTATAGLNVQNQDNTTLLPRDYVVCPIVIGDKCGNNGAGSINLGVEDSAGSFSIGQGNNTSGSLTVGTTLTPQQLVSTAVGFNLYTLSQSSYSASTIGLPIGVSVPAQFSYVDGNGPSYGSVNQATYGWYVQPTLNLHSRFFVSPGFRLDGGSNSGTSSGGGLSAFPKIDFSWIALERTPDHPFFGALTLLRPRIAFGIAGIQPGPGQQLRLLQPAQSTPLTSSGAGAPVDVLQVSSLGNPALHPERDRELEGGFDAEFWNQRLTLTLTGYHKMAYDAILAVPVAPSVVPTGGGGGYAVNIGNIRNTGIEATVSARLLDSRLVNWSVNASVTRNRNLLVSLAPGQPSIDIQDGGTQGLFTRLVPGYPLNGQWAYPIIGFADVNHDGRIDVSEVRLGNSLVFVGAQVPDYELTLSPIFSFFNNRLTISTSFDYQNGLTQNLTNTNNTNDGAISFNPTLTQAQQAAIAVSSCLSGTTANCSDIGLLQTVNTLRWNSLSISYEAPPQIAALVHSPRLSFALQGSNLGLFSHYRGIDPNVNAFSSGNLTQDTGGILPQPRIWNLRVTLGH